MFRFWDNGYPTLPTISWEGHDEGDAHPNSEMLIVEYSSVFS